MNAFQVGLLGSCCSTFNFYSHLFHQLCTVPNRGVCKEAVGALLNLAINIKVRARVGFLGGIQVLLGKFT